MSTAFISSDNLSSEELARLIELQRRQNELLRPDIDSKDQELLNEENDDFSVTKRKRPAVPDMRFEKQFEASVLRLREKGASNLSIFCSAVLKDQILMPFISGFAWNVLSSTWKWYRTKKAVNNSRKNTGFFRGIQHIVTGWSR
ncbi:MAG: hypothetical protein EXX96DRAFT_538917 [Benjaminiella poitrasii]|nr:MAG: hypothetical protein EXX96DRAFT_538917 [Benjaminiella poitrasii]